MDNYKAVNNNIVEQDLSVLKAAFSLVCKSPIARGHISHCLNHYRMSDQLSWCTTDEQEKINEALLFLEDTPYVSFDLGLTLLQSTSFKRQFMLLMMSQLEPVLKGKVNKWIKRPEHAGMGNWHARQFAADFNDVADIGHKSKADLAPAVNGLLKSVTGVIKSFDNAIQSLIENNSGFLFKKSSKYVIEGDKVLLKEDYFQEACIAIDRAYSKFEPGQSQIMTFIDMVVSSRFNNIRKKTMNENNLAMNTKHVIKDNDENFGTHDPLLTTQTDVDINVMRQAIEAEDGSIQQMLSLRFGLNTDDECSYDDIASEVGRSRESIRTKDLPMAMDRIRNQLDSCAI